MIPGDAYTAYHQATEAERFYRDSAGRSELLRGEALAWIRDRCYQDEDHIAAAVGLPVDEVRRLIARADPLSRP